MLPGDKAEVEIKKQQNRIMASKGDWVVIEAAKVWNIYGNKYTVESTSKQQCQLHDIPIHCTKELERVDRLRNIVVPGLVMRGNQTDNMKLLGKRFDDMQNSLNLFFSIGPTVQSLSLYWGPQGVNVTRFRRRRPARMESTIDKFGMSLSATLQHT
ncbi:hypothetical protein BGX20_011632 [Mortierella sp. AD010]|nr:hypothetical protein BGX20_011632 [Mortierella sp. AD010]